MIPQPRMPRLTRRRLLVIAAAATLVAPARAERWEWHGAALGAEARMILDGPRDRAEAALEAVTAEIARLERIFSLHRPDSQLSRLNRAGELAAPAHDLVDLIAAAEDWRTRTAGAFDIRVQQLWNYRVGNGAGPLPAVTEARILLSPGRVTLSPGAALTLNGIAQGMIADRVADMLGNFGFRPPLIDAGEMRLGATQSVIIPGTRLTVRPGCCALSTSAPDALRFGADRGHHLFHPATGTSPEYWRSLTVFAPDACTADALSTAFAVSPPELIGDLVPPGISVIAVAHDGDVRRFGQPLGPA